MNTEVLKLMEYLSDKEIVDIELLKKKTTLSQRQIQYRLDKINELLKEHSLSSLRIEHRKLQIPHDVRAVLKQETRIQKEKLCRWSYAFEKEERLAYLYISLFIRKPEEYISTNSFAVGLQVGKTTVFADIRDLKQSLKEKDIELLYDRRRGYYMEGPESNVRNMLMHMIIRLFSEKSDSLICNLIIKENALMTFEKTKKQIDKIALCHGLEFVPKRLDEFVYIFIFLFSRMRYYPTELNIPSKSIMTTFKEYRFAADLMRFFEEKGEIREEDLLYITSWILGVSFGNEKEATGDYEIISEFVKKMVERFNAVSGQQRELTEDMFNQLYAHMRPAYYRLVFNLPVLNPLTEQIKDEFAELFLLVKETMKSFKLFLGREVPDSEIAYLTIHFACIYRSREEESLKTLPEDNAIPRALIVCSNGIGSSMILYNELTEMFPDMYFYKPIATGELKNFQEKADLIFTTDMLFEFAGEDTPVIRVHPIISDTERRQLINEVNLKWNQNLLTEVDQLLELIGQYADIHDREELKNQLIIYEAEHSVKIPEKPKGTGLHLLDLFRKEFVSLQRSAGDWREAIRMSYETFLQERVISENYVEQTIRAVENKGPYIVIAPQIALAHSLPEDGALENAMGLTVLKEPVSFGDPENDPIKYIFTLSIKGGQNHMAAMSELVNLFHDPYFWHITDKTKKPEDIINYVKAIYG